MGTWKFDDNKHPLWLAFSCEDRESPCFDVSQKSELLVKFLKGHNWVPFPKDHCTLWICYLKFKFCYLKNLKLFSIGGKGLFEPKVLQKSWQGFCSFLKMRSWDTYFWVTLGTFKVQTQPLQGEYVFSLKLHR